MKIIYVGNDIKKQRAMEHLDDVIMLLHDNWDDYDYKTTFPTSCRIEGQSVELGSVRILFEGEMTSYEYLDKLVEKGWDGVFPVPKVNYVSTPAALTFYELIEGHLDFDSAIDVAQTLRDASYLTRIEDDLDALRLVTSPGFKRSLQRERGSIKAFLDGWKLFGRKGVSIENQTFIFRSVKRELLSLDLKFVSQSPLPHDINVLIGPNGVGKSQLLHQIVEYWLDDDPDSAERIRFSTRPNLSQVIVVSYSPFELFPVDVSDDEKKYHEKKDHELKDRGVYRYFGLRGRKKSITDSKRGSDKVTLNRQFPKTNAANSLLDCLNRHDNRRHS